MRKPLSSYFLTSFSHINSDCTTDCKNVDFHSQTLKLSSSSSSYKFTFCSWEGCLSEPAGAISSSQAGASLSVMNCKFNNCNSTSDTTATKDYNGGAICVNGLSTITVSSSVFFNCRAPQTNKNDCGSGGIYTHSIHNSISLSLSAFISCFTGTSGAALFFESVSSTQLNPEIISDCKFIQCRSQDTTPDGGGMTLWERVYTIRCISCFFSGCSTTGVGGGFDYYFSANYESYPIKFCFFNRNTGGAGNDIALAGLYTLVGKLLLHCFSTSDPSRVAYLTSTWSLGDFNWLPQGVSTHLTRLMDASFEISAAYTFLLRAVIHTLIHLITFPFFTFEAQAIFYFLVWSILLLSHWQTLRNSLLRSHYKNNALLHFF